MLLAALPVIFAGLLVGLVLFAALYRTYGLEDEMFNLTPCELALFIVGMLGAILFIASLPETIAVESGMTEIAVKNLISNLKAVLAAGTAVGRISVCR